VLDSFYNLPLPSPPPLYLVYATFPPSSYVRTDLQTYTPPSLVPRICGARIAATEYPCEVLFFTIGWATRYRCRQAIVIFADCLANSLRAHAALFVSSALLSRTMITRSCGHRFSVYIIWMASVLCATKHRCVWCIRKEKRTKWNGYSSDFFGGG
jgi:hypothetical protein